MALEPVEALVTQARVRRSHGRGAPSSDEAYWTVNAPTGRLVSLYPVVLPVLVAPLYLPAVAYLHARGWTETRVDHVARLMEKLTASFLASLSAGLLHLTLRRRAAAPTALLLTAAYAFGTTTWMIGSQALWQHGMAQVLIAGLMLLLTGPRSTPRAIGAGLLCGLIAGNRPPDAILAAALGVYGLVWAGRQFAGWLVAAAVVAPALVVLYNVTMVGLVGGAYTVMGRPTFFQHDMRSGLAGLLFSPTRGLFVFSPFLLLLPLAWWRWWREGRDRGLALAVTAGVVAQLLLYSRIDWRGGLAFGPRFMTDLLPLLVWLLVPAAAALRGAGRVCFVAAIAVAIAIQAIGAFAYTGVTDRPIYAVAQGPDRLKAAWEWPHAPFIAPLSLGLAPAELLHRRVGTIDAVEVNGLATGTIVEGEQATVVGWTLVGRSSPLQVGVAIDGQAPATTRDFTARADVDAVFPGAAPAGWRVPIETAGLAPGEHQLSVHLWTTEASEAYLVTRRAVTVQAAADAAKELARHAGTAAARVRANQQDTGSWLTAFTSGTRFEKPHPEMNTYVTALLVDLLDPVAAANGLDSAVQRARQHLTAQIEAGGLVRYHGLPTAPGIGTLGCAITPDTDDTALVWRIAPPADRRPLAPALATIEAYRRPDGLYRTWLAPRTRFQCLDPGRDPNPADVAIQMHLLQLLAAERPAAGRALCAALRRDIADDRIWVYYARSPLVPILRLPDLARAGCRLELPASRLATTVDGQDVWVSLVRHLAGTAPAGAPAIDALLRQLARDDFALLRTNPPLLYHNDLTASVSRYYWSEDVGYALWLRLAYEHAHIGPPESAR